MEYTNETVIFSLLYIVCTNWVYIREYKGDKTNRVIKRGREWD
jgi:hypothetical protein